MPNARNRRIVDRSETALRHQLTRRPAVVEAHRQRLQPLVERVPHGRLDAHRRSGRQHPAEPGTVRPRRRRAPAAARPAATGRRGRRSVTGPSMICWITSGKARPQSIASDAVERAADQRGERGPGVGVQPQQRPDRLRVRRRGRRGSCRRRRRMGSVSWRWCSSTSPGEPTSGPRQARPVSERRDGRWSGQCLRYGSTGFSGP